MRLVAISDTHGLHEQLTIPDGDVIIHAGDFTDDVGQASLRAFCKWYAGLTFCKKICVAGNHDGAFEKWPDAARRMVVDHGITYLQEESVTIEGVKFYGMPHTPAFCNWYFNVARSHMHWFTEKIPLDTDVLITHGPPKGHLDVSGFGNESVGCEALRSRVEAVQPKAHVFGHIHHSYGWKDFTYETGHRTVFMNCSVCNEAYKPINKPQVYEI